MNNYTSQFINDFQYCPFCLSPMAISAKGEATDKHTYQTHFNYTTNTLDITVRGNYFIDISSVGDYKFSIKIEDGKILPSTFANDFVSLYEVSIRLTKKCYCPINFFRFLRETRLSYDRLISDFILTPIYETFSFQYENNEYQFTNNYAEHYSSLQGTHIPPQRTPQIPFDKFNFDSAASLYGKLNAIHLLV